MKIRLKSTVLIIFIAVIALFSGCRDTGNQSFKIDPSLQFRDETGKLIRLGDYLYIGRPVILTPVYYKCPSVCNLQLNRLSASLSLLDVDLKKDLTLLAVSFNPAENSQIAEQKKNAYLQKYPLKNAEEGWIFLTGEFPQIKALTKSLHFEYYIDKDSREFIHKPVTYFLDQNGHVMQILPGAKQAVSVVKLMLANASHGSYGSFSDRMLWFFLSFDEEKEELTLNLWNGIRFVLTLFLLMLLFVKRFKFKS